MKHKTTNWMLFIGALLLGGFILIFERHSENSHQQMTRARTVFAVYPENIEWLQMERDGVQIGCAKQAGQWRLTQPADAPVDTGVVEKMIAGLARVERGELITAKTLQERSLTPADYGFDAPRARITFKNNLGTSTWLIGRDAPVGDMLYVMAEHGGDIIAAPQTLLNLIPQNPSWIRDHSLFSDEISAVRGLDLRRPAGFLQLRQPENNGWLMQQPHAGRADQQAVQTLIGKLFSGRILEFTSDVKTDLTVYGLAKPTYELTVFTQDERTQTLLIGNPVPEKQNTFYAKQSDRDSVFTVAADWIRELDLDETLLRNRQIINLSPDRVTAIQITHNDHPVELVRTNTLWHVVRPVRWDADAKQVQVLLNALTQATVVEFIDEPIDGSMDPHASAPWTLALTAAGKTNIVRITESDTNALRQVQYNDEPARCTTAANILRDEFADPLFYRNRTVLEVNPSQIQTLTVQSDGIEHIARKTETGSFAAGSPDRQLNTKALTDLMWSLNNLRAERYVDYNPATLAPYGLETPQTTLLATLSDPQSIGRMVLLGDPTPGGRFAMVQGQNIVFVVSDKTAQTLTRELTVPIEKQPEELTQP
jgi:hypothetical protein